MTTPSATSTAVASSLDTMLTTFEHGIEVVESIMPEVAAIGGLVPGASPFIQLAGLALPVLQNSIKLIMQEEGKTPLQAFEDVLRHLMPGQPLSPTLSAGSTVPSSTGGLPSFTSNPSP